jgi:uncharacterized hydrophobic protein (TIGR00271 family)
VSDDTPDRAEREAEREAGIEAAKRVAAVIEHEREIGETGGVGHTDGSAPGPDDEGVVGAADEPSADPSLSIHRRKIHRWWHRQLEPQERQRVMAELAIKRQDGWSYRFTTMITLSVVVAVMGLSADSAAVVIGAMLLAPLMTPVLATAACIAMGLFKRASKAFGIVVLATVGSIALSYFLAKFTVNGELPHEVTMRTAPDIRDLIVALGAGTAGAYATVRKDASSSLPGVAVAVALVPPLGTVGIALEAGNATFARGALLLYTTNLAAIILAGVVVFVVTGFVPPRRLATTFVRSALVSLAVGVVVIVIAVPLYRASRTAVAASERQIAAIETVDAWLGGQVDRAVEPEVTFDGLRMIVRVRSFDPPIDLQPLNDAVHDRFGDDIGVSVEWDKVERATATTTTEPASTVVDEEAQRATVIEGVVRDWLTSSGDDRRLDSIAVVDNEIRIDASGVGAPPQVEGLNLLLDDVFDEQYVVRLTWLARENVEATAAPTPDEVLSTQISDLADQFASEHDVIVLNSSFDGASVVIDLAGEVAPDATGLVEAVQNLVGPDDTVRVLFTERRDITSTTTTTTTTPTTTTTTTTVPPTTAP